MNSEAQGLEIHLELDRHLATEAVEYAISGLPIVTCAVVSLTDVFLVEEVLHITRDCGLVATHVEGVASGEVYQAICRHLPRCLKVLHTIDGEIATAEGVVSIVVGEVLPI